MRLSVLLVWVLAGVAASLPAGEWPHWRGPRGDGRADEPDTPLRWSRTENVRWKVRIPGKGHSSPVTHGNLVFVTTCDADKKQRILLCLNADEEGAERWRKVVLTAPLEQKHRRNSYASSTPATDGERVWVCFYQKPFIRVVCYDARSGERLWRATPGTFRSMHGFCSSLVLHKDMLILNGDQDAKAFLVALDQETGRERWRTDRPNRTRSYCVPWVTDLAGKPQLVLSGNLCVAGYDPDTGRQHWIVDGPTDQFVSSPVQADGILFVTYGFPKRGLMGIRPDGAGNVTKSHVAWNEPNRRLGGYVPSPIAVDGRFYVTSDSGWLSCLDAKTGRHLYEKRIGRGSSTAAVYAAGRLYFLMDSGETIVVKPGDNYVELARNPLREHCQASPALSRGRLYIRTATTLYCIQNGAGE